MTTQRKRTISTLLTITLMLTLSALWSGWRGAPEHASRAVPQAHGAMAEHASDGHPSAAKSANLSDLSLPAQAAVSATLGRDNAAYHAVARGRGFHAANPQHALAADFTPDGIEVSTGATRWRLRLDGYGYGEALTAVSAANPQASANRVEYRRGAVTEWYINGPLGLEQGFTLAQAPGEARGEPLTLALALGGDLRARLEPAGAGLTLATGSGPAALRYSGVSAWDASGRELRAWLELREAQVWLRVDDARARYPVVVDPFVQQAKLTASDGVQEDLFGQAVAISGDTVVVGATSADIGGNSNQGAAYVFVKPAGGWAGALSEQAKLTASDGATGENFGFSVALSGDTVVVGALSANAAYVFVKPAGGWAGTLSEQAKLTASDGAVGDDFGVAVALSGDTLVAGASSANAAYVFVKPAGGWAGTLSEQAKLTASDGAVGDDFGVAVALSGDTLVVGAMFDDISGNSGQGSAYVFVKPAGGWAGTLSEQAKLTASDGAVGDLFGQAVAISGDTVVVGATSADIGGNDNQGAAYVFVKPAGGWAGALVESAKLTASDGAAGDLFGGSDAVAISGDTVVIGSENAAVGANDGQGAIYVFVKPAGGWAGALVESAKLTASDGGAGDDLGESVAISGATIVAGADTANAAYMFVSPGFDFSGFFQPVDNPPTVNVVNAGRAIPVKFSLGGDQGLSIFAAGFPASQQITCNTSDPVSSIEETVTAGSSSLSYDAATDTYTYVWKTNKAWKGTCRQLIVRLNDGSDHVAHFQFK